MCFLNIAYRLAWVFLYKIDDYGYYTHVYNRNNIQADQPSDWAR